MFSAKEQSLLEKVGFAPFFIFRKCNPQNFSDTERRSLMNPTETERTSLGKTLKRKDIS
jgi:hypothetical protein